MTIKYSKVYKGDSVIIASFWASAPHEFFDPNFKIKVHFSISMAKRSWNVLILLEI